MKNKKNPFGINPINPLPEYDGEPVDSDEVEAAMMADLAERGREVDAELLRRQTLSDRPLLNQTMVVGLLMIGGSLCFSLCTWALSSDGSYYAANGVTVLGIFVLVRAVITQKYDESV